MPKYKPPTIKELGGTLAYLDRTMSIHNNYGGAEFIKRLELREPHTIIARAFKVERKAIPRWIDNLPDEFAYLKIEAQNNLKREKNIL